MVEASRDSQRKLSAVAAFRMPSTWNTLRALLTGERKACRDDRELDAILTELEDRGLMGWTKATNRYDLHPIVRGIVWHTLDGQERQGICANLEVYFDALPKVDPDSATRLEDLTPALELFHALIGMDRFEEAWVVFQTRLSKVMHFPTVCTNLLVYKNNRQRAWLYECLSGFHLESGNPGFAAKLLLQQLELLERNSSSRVRVACLDDLPDSLYQSGRLHDAQAAALESLALNREVRYFY
jgi:hypothetical protein